MIKYRNMRATVNKTGESVEVRQVRAGWWVDEDDSANVYRSDELTFDDEEDEEDDEEDGQEGFPAFVISSLLAKNNIRANIMDWREKRFQLVMKLIDIYQAPAVNMAEIIGLADRYIKALMDSETRDLAGSKD